MLVQSRPKANILLSTEVAFLPSLETLNVACNNITTISPCVGSMQRLRCLNVSRNDITHLPDGIGTILNCNDESQPEGNISSLPKILSFCIQNSGGPLP